MKKTYTIYAILFLASASLMAQKAPTEDENGRPVGARPLNAVSVTRAVFMEEGTAAGANTSTVTLNYSLPENMNSGKMVVFHPSQDKELKTIQLSSRMGSTSINKSEIGLEEFVVGMYDSSGKFIQEYRVRAKK